MGNVSHLVTRTAALQSSAEAGLEGGGGRGPEPVREGGLTHGHGRTRTNPPIAQSARTNRRVHEIERLLRMQAPKRSQNDVVEAQDQRRQETIGAERPGHVQLIHRHPVIVERLRRTEALAEHGHPMAVLFQHERRVH